MDIEEAIKKVLRVQDLSSGLCNDSILNYRDLRSSGYTLNTGWDPEKAMIYTAGLEALLYGNLRVREHPLHIVLLRDVPLPIAAGQNDWQDLLPSVINSLGMRPLPNLRWHDNRRGTGKFHLNCDNIIFAAVSPGIVVQGFAILGDIFSTTGIQPFMVASTRPTLHSNGGDLILDFGFEGIFQVDAISGCAAGLHNHARR